MATLYFNGAVNDQWNTLGNWWTDSAHTIPAASLPGIGDDVVVADGVSAYCSPIVPATAANVTVGPGGVLTGACNFSGMATFNSSSFAQGGYLTGNATFNAGGNSGTVGGNATFNNSTNTYHGLVAGNATFNGSSYSIGFVVGDATFNGISFNSYGVNGDATFNGSSYNSGFTNGDATFNDSSYNSAIGAIAGTETYANRTPYPIPRGINGSSILGVI